MTKRTFTHYFVVSLVTLLMACQVRTAPKGVQATTSIPPQDPPASGPSSSPTIDNNKKSVIQENDNAQPDPTIPANANFDKMSLWVDGPFLRGANIYQRRVYPELDGPDFMGSGTVGPPYTQEDFYHLASLGANYVNISHPGLFTENPPYILDENIQNNLDNTLSMIAAADMFAVISFRTGPGRSEFTFFWDEVGDWFDSSYLNDSVWGNQAAQDAWVKMWRYTAQRYKHNPIVVGYDLMVEPNSNEVGSHALDDTLDIWDPEEFYTLYGGTLYDWNQLYPEITDAIRGVDANTPIIIGGLGYSHVDWLPYLEPLDDKRIVYAVHQYAPFRYTHQNWDDIQYTYPDTFDTDWDGVDEQFNKSWLDDLLTIVDDFKVQYSVPVAVNEFGVVRWVPNAAEFIDDQIDLFEQRRLNHAIWNWDPTWQSFVEENNAFNFRFGADPQNHSDVDDNQLMADIKKYWQRNSYNPSTVITQTSYLPFVTNESITPTHPIPLSEVDFWAYQLQDINSSKAVTTLISSHYDMIVLEPTRTDWSSDDKYFDTSAFVSQLKKTTSSDGQHRKLIIAYIDIGEAEDWRWYWTWSNEWDCEGQLPQDWPDFIISCDPDGWSGNYPVAYWDNRWKDIIIYGNNTSKDPERNYSSALDEVLTDGFDGIYLDWVEAYEDSNVAAAAHAAGKHPAAEMIDFINEIREYAVSRDPDFIIIQQNAAALIDQDPDLTDIIDAIAQEAIWFDRLADVPWENPDGADIKNDQELTNYYLSFLSRYQQAGVPVLNCEYALDHANTAYYNSYLEGFIPYVTRSSLSQLTTTPPPGY